MFQTVNHNADVIFCVSFLVLVYVTSCQLVIPSCLLFAITSACYLVIRKKRAKMISGEGKYVLITGCDSGFGNALARALDTRGMCVFATCLSENSDGAKYLKEVGSKRLRVLQMDVSSDQSISDCRIKVEDFCCDTGLWAVVNNAGILTAAAVEFESMSNYKRVAEVNLFGMVRVCKAFLPLIRKCKGFASAFLSSLVVQAFHLHYIWPSEGTDIMEYVIACVFGVTPLLCLHFVHDLESGLKTSFFITVFLIARPTETHPVNLAQEWSGMIVHSKISSWKFWKGAIIPDLSRGRVVNVTSVEGLTVKQRKSAYHITKFGGEGFSDSLRLEMKRFGVKVILVEPGGYGLVTGLFNAQNVNRYVKLQKEAVDSASDELREAYGQEYLDKSLFVPKMRTNASDSDIGPVVEAMEDAVLSSQPRYRYLVDGIKFDRICVLARLNQVLPAFIMDRLTSAWL